MAEEPGLEGLRAELDAERKARQAQAERLEARLEALEQRVGAAGATGGEPAPPQTDDLLRLLGQKSRVEGPEFLLAENAALRAEVARLTAKVARFEHEREEEDRFMKNWVIGLENQGCDLRSAKRFAPPSFRKYFADRGSNENT
mmetsp:Transcript_9610/g.28745  ORF Transcript_9610/g.28745 Transcript_9610/m.28745 type:complete len:144 (+) Transcript_9610:142-573(+)